MTHNSLPHPADNFVGSYENLTAAISFPTQKALVQIVFSTNRCHFISMVILMAFLLSPLGLLQPYGDRVSRFIYSIHIYHWLLQQGSDTCCFVLFLSEIAIKLFHVRKELLWYHRVSFLCSFFFPAVIGLVVRFTSWGRRPEALMRMLESHLSLLCSVRKLLWFPQLWAHVVYYWPSVEKNLHKKSL